MLAYESFGKSGRMLRSWEFFSVACTTVQTWWRSVKLFYAQMSCAAALSNSGYVISTFKSRSQNKKTIGWSHVCGVLNFVNLQVTIKTVYIVMHPKKKKILCTWTIIFWHILELFLILHFFGEMNKSWLNFSSFFFFGV